MKLGRAHWIFVLVGFTFILSIMSTRLELNESLAEISQLRGDATSGFDPLKAARQVVNEARKAWKEWYEGDPSLAKQKFAQSMKKVDQDFAPVRAAIDKSSEQDQKVFALEYFEQMNTLVREQIIWLENKIAAEADPKLKQEFQRHLKDYKNQYPQWETELQRLKSELRWSEDRWYKAMGLFVLLGFIAYVLVATFIVSAIGKYGGSKIAKYVTIAVFVLIPAWDIIPGQLYFQHLCETEAGVKVIKTMKMDQSYFKSDGKPDEKKLAERYAHVTKFDRNFSAIFHIAKTESTIQDKRTKEILGTAANFSHRGGWLTTLVLVDAAGTSCPAYPFFAMHSAVLESVFRPSVLRPT